MDNQLHLFEKATRQEAEDARAEGDLVSAEILERAAQDMQRGRLMRLARAA